MIHAWGFEYKTVAFVWVKQNRKSDGLFWGMGYWTRANAEICVLATKGHPHRANPGVHQVILSHIEQHSKKPDEVYEKYAAGTISREEYIKQKSEADVKLAENDKAIQCGHERMQQLDSEQSCSDKRLDAVSREIKVNGLLTYELAHAFVEAIYVHDHDGIEIVWKFKDIFEETVNDSSSLR